MVEVVNRIRCEFGKPSFNRLTHVEVKVQLMTTETAPHPEQNTQSRIQVPAGLTGLTDLIDPNWADNVLHPALGVVPAGVVVGLGSR